MSREFTDTDIISSYLHVNGKDIKLFNNKLTLSNNFVYHSYEYLDDEGYECCGRWYDVKYEVKDGVFTNTLENYRHGKNPLEDPNPYGRGCKATFTVTFK